VDANVLPEEQVPALLDDTTDAERRSQRLPQFIGVLD